MQASENEKNQDALGGTSDASIGESIDNLSTVTNLVKSQKSDLTNHKAL